jgi:hypothetical protein
VYAKQVILGRIIALMASSRMSTQVLLNTYLLTWCRCNESAFHAPCRSDPPRPG